MESFEVFVLFIIIICSIIIYKRYSPKIDIVVSGERYIVLLWYYKYKYVEWDEEECERTYKKLFEI